MKYTGCWVMVIFMFLGDRCIVDAVDLAVIARAMPMNDVTQATNTLLAARGGGGGGGSYIRRGGARSFRRSSSMRQSRVRSSTRQQRVSRVKSSRASRKTSRQAQRTTKTTTKASKVTTQASKTTATTTQAKTGATIVGTTTAKVGVTTASTAAVAASATAPKIAGKTTAGATATKVGGTATAGATTARRGSTTTTTTTTTTAGGTTTTTTTTVRTRTGAGFGPGRWRWAHPRRYWGPWFAFGFGVWYYPWWGYWYYPPFGCWYYPWWNCWYFHRWGYWYYPGLHFSVYLASEPERIVFVDNDSDDDLYYAVYRRRKIGDTYYLYRVEDPLYIERRRAVKVYLPRDKDKEYVVVAEKEEDKLPTRMSQDTSGKQRGLLEDAGKKAPVVAEETHEKVVVEDLSKKDQRKLKKMKRDLSKKKKELEKLKKKIGDVTDPVAVTKDMKMETDKDDREMPRMEVNAD